MLEWCAATPIFPRSLRRTGSFRHSSARMIVSHRQGFIFFHNPKCAGTTVRSALQPWHDDPQIFRGFFEAPFFRGTLDHAHLRLWELQALFPRILEAAATYRSVIIVRDPFRRFVSAVAHHFRYFQPNVTLAGLPPEQQIAAVEAFLDQVLSLGAIMTDVRFVHFSPQVWFILLGGRVVPRDVLPLDPPLDPLGDSLLDPPLNPPGDFARGVFTALGLPGRVPAVENVTAFDLTPILSSAKISDFVRTFYAPDFAFFSGQPGLAHLASAGCSSIVNPDGV